MNTHYSGFKMRDYLGDYIGKQEAMPTINVLSKNKKNIIIFHLKIIFFTAMKNHCILHGHVIVMLRGSYVGCSSCDINLCINLVSLITLVRL